MFALWYVYQGGTLGIVQVGECRLWFVVLHHRLASRYAGSYSWFDTEVNVV